MSSSTTVTKTLDITVNDTENKDTTFKLNNPKSGVTKTEIDNVFSDMIQNSILYSRYGNLMNQVVGAKVTTITTTKEEVL